MPNPKFKTEKLTAWRKLSQSPCPSLIEMYKSLNSVPPSQKLYNPPDPNTHFSPRIETMRNHLAPDYLSMPIWALIIQEFGSMWTWPFQ